MIYRLQRKFILISAVSVFAVIAIIFILITALNVSSMNRTLDQLADRISVGDGRFSKPSDGHEPTHEEITEGNDFITSETPFSTRYFSVWFNKSGEIVRTDTEFIYAVSESDAEKYAESVIDKGIRGWVSVYRYKVYDTEGGKAVIFIDGSMSRTSLLHSVIISASVLLGAAIVILMLIIVFSKRVMKPVADSYERQKQFITDANHELKTPLTLILANLDIAEAELGENEWLKDMRAEGERMTDLVNQLISLTRMDESDTVFSFGELNLSEIVNDTVSEFSGLAIERGKHLTSKVEPQVLYMGNEGMLRRLISVFLDNAVKYCDEQGEIFLCLTKRRHIVLTVENSYCAVDSVELDRLFDRFYRADGARTYTGGFGVGLSIAQAIVQKHRGEINAYKKDESHIGFKVILK